MSTKVANSEQFKSSNPPRMREELEQIMRARHERIFFRMNRERVPHPDLVCGDGWFPLLNHLCASLQERTDNDGAPQFVLKKLGTVNGRLQFDGYGGSKDVVHEALIKFAQDLSVQTCECCGAPGALVESDSETSFHARCMHHAEKGSCTESTDDLFSDEE